MLTFIAHPSHPRLRRDTHTSVSTYMDAITGSMSSSPCKVKVAGIRTTENTAPIIKILLTKGHTLHDIVPRMAVHMNTQHSIPWASWDAVFDIHLDAVTKDVLSSQSAFKLCTQTSFMREAFELSYPRLNVYRIAWATPLERAFNGQAKVYLLVDLPDEKLARHTLSREIKAAARENARQSLQALRPVYGLPGVFDRDGSPG